ncbi:hypothetical protein SAMN05660350_00787 [Geodermatophilus obscurus]|uniref:Uncharacterized protein n=1 Tax=Geodermatophilus obscurus TaxID=1861 RepID=A0A1M7SGA8_9ACTN|nr:hypothetical protein SAMN05660350_00787 [Geodermatophilus obscurus]
MAPIGPVERFGADSMRPAAGPDRHRRRVAAPAGTVPPPRGSGPSPIPRPRGRDGRTRTCDPSTAAAGPRGPDSGPRSVRPDRWSPAEEGVQPLAEVRRGAERHRLLPLDGQALVEGQVDALGDAAPDGRQRPRRLPGQPLGVALHLLAEPLGSHHDVDEADGAGLLGAEQGAVVEEAQRPWPPQQAGQRLRRADRWDEPDADLRLPEASGARGGAALPAVVLNRLHPVVHRHPQEVGHPPSPGTCVRSWRSGSPWRRTRRAPSGGGGGTVSPPPATSEADPAVCAWSVSPPDTRSPRRSYWSGTRASHVVPLRPSWQHRGTPLPGSAVEQRGGAAGSLAARTGVHALVDGERGGGVRVRQVLGDDLHPARHRPGVRAGPGNRRVVHGYNADSAHRDRRDERVTVR